MKDYTKEITYYLKEKYDYKTQEIDSMLNKAKELILYWNNERNTGNLDNHLSPDLMTDEIVELLN